MNILELPKHKGSFSRNPNSSKYYISCSDKITKKTPTTEGWIKILKSLKLTHDYDKSRILLSLLNSHKKIIVKISDTNDIKKEYDFGILLQKIKGFVKYYCYFECNDDFRKYPSDEKNTLCNGNGSSMKIILMPYFELGSIASYNWNNTNIHILQSCLKHSVLSILNAFFTLHIIHGDFHAGNVVLKVTKQKELIYEDIKVLTNGIRPWIMDFENSSFANYDTVYNKMITLNNFYYDIIKFFSTLPTYIKNINFITLQPIIAYISQLHLKGNILNKNYIHTIINLIDSIRLIEQPPH